MLLKRIKNDLRISTDLTDGSIAGYIMAAAADLRTSAGIPVEGVSLTVDWRTDPPTVTDNSTITDDLIIRAITAYVRFSYGSAYDADKQKAAYDEMKSQMQRATGYGLPEDEDEEE